MKRFVNVPMREMKKARIEIIPMIDTIFFLLVFFMFTSLSMVKMNGMGVSLPKDSALVSTPPPQVVITVDGQGRYFLGTRTSGRPVVTPITPGQLLPALQADVNADPRTVLIVNVNKGRNVQDLMDVMDAVNTVQLPLAARTADDNAPAVTIATTPVDAGGQPLAATPETH